MTPQQMEFLRQMIGKDYTILSTPLSQDAMDALIVIPWKLHKRDLDKFHEYVAFLEHFIVKGDEVETQVGPTA